MDVEKAVNEILEDLEHQPLQKSRTFQAYLNNPELISISSTNAQQQSPPINANLYNSYYNFTINLPRPAIGAKSIQLLKAVVPQAQCSIPDYSLVFPYYKLACVPIDLRGTLYVLEDIDYTKLKFIRLLPSTNKYEIMDIDLSANQVQRSNFAYNKTFNDYEDLLVELKKACIYDPLEQYDVSGNYQSGDITFEFDDRFNKFIMKGNNVSTPNTFGAWQEPFLYQEGMVVNYLGIDYLCLEANVGEEPPTSENWLNVSQFYSTQPKFNTYLIAGYDDPNVERLLKFIEKRGTFLDQPWLTSIPANKYVKSQTLARRLGFTWDGTGMIIDKDDIFTAQAGGIAYGSTVALFFNRFRPIVKYAYTLPLLEGDFFPVFNVNNKYTADGYCNLVYSSIINIYTTIVGTSSVDTQKNANLLATLEMNCANLGVMMSSSFIDTKLTKLQPDIYSIYFELRDENGEPYLLTNNATTTLLLKLTYPE